jgi:DNA-binding NtrC family response regulator
MIPIDMLPRSGKMNYRVFIFDDQEDIRQTLWSLFNGRGYEVFTFPHPGACPLDEMEICPCPIGQACADVILSDLNMPFKKGLEFLEEQIKKGCCCEHMALMSGAFTNEDMSKAESLGIRIFKKPFDLVEIIHWLDEIESHIEPKRELSDWFIEKIPKISGQV